MLSVFISIGAGTAAFTTAYFLYRAHRRDKLEEKQLNQFIEQLVFCPDCKDWIVGNKTPIAKMKKLK